MVKTLCWIQYTKNNGSKKNGGRLKYVAQIIEDSFTAKQWKTWLLNLCKICKPKKNNKKKHYLKSTSKLNYMSQNIFDNKLVAIRKNKVTLILNKPAYVRMCFFELSKVLMYKFHYGYPESQDYYSPTTIV